MNSIELEENLMELTHQVMRLEVKLENLEDLVKRLAEFHKIGHPHAKGLI